MSPPCLLASSAAVVLRICGGAGAGALSRHPLSAAPVAFRRFATSIVGQDVKEGTEDFTLSVGPDSSDDGPEAILYDPSTRGLREPAPPVSKSGYKPPWQRGKTAAPPETSKATGLPDSDPVFKTENDIKDI